MIARRVLLTGTGAAVLASPFLASVRARGQALPLVALLIGGAGSHKAFLEALREQSYREGHSVRIEMRFHHGQADRCPSLAAELVALKPTVILGSSPYDIPIVGLDLESDPVAAGFVASIARPGGNITGIFLDLPELSGKLLQLLRDSVPRLERVGVIWDENISQGQFLAVKERGPGAGAARSLPAGEEGRRPRAGGGPSGAGASRRGGGAQLAADGHRVGGAHRAAAQAPASLHQRLRCPRRVRRAVRLRPRLSWDVAASSGIRGADREGGFPGRDAGGTAREVHLLVNLKTARAIGLTVSPVVLDRADRIIE